MSRKFAKLKKNLEKIITECDLFAQSQCSSSERYIIIYLNQVSLRATELIFLINSIEENEVNNEKNIEKVSNEAYEIFNAYRKILVDLEEMLIKKIT